MPTSTKVTMDPWLEGQNPDSGELASEKSEQTETVSESTEIGVNRAADVDASATGFDNNFKPFLQLPDSPEYLERLEKKLQGLQGGTGTNKKPVTSQEILTSLGQTRESYMMRLLRDSVSPAATENDEPDSHDELNVNPILKKIAPEKQAIALEELVHLIKADQLAAVLESESDSPTADASLTTQSEPSAHDQS